VNVYESERERTESFAGNFAASEQQRLFFEVPECHFKPGVETVLAYLGHAYIWCSVRGFRTAEVSVMTAMNPPDEFLKHAADCEQMAKFTRDPESMATWNRMAERWRRCAEIFTSQNSGARHQMPAKPHRHPVPGWAHH
jgi:hypothetical protein